MIFWRSLIPFTSFLTPCVLADPAQVEATYYYTLGATGACGVVMKDSDYVVAAGTNILGDYTNPADSPACGKEMNITFEGNAAKGIVQDSCESCDDGHLDFGTALWADLYFGDPNGDPETVGTPGQIAVAWVWS